MPKWCLCRKKSPLCFLLSNFRILSQFCGMEDSEISVQIALPKHMVKMVKLREINDHKGYGLKTAGPGRTKEAIVNDIKARLIT